MGRQEPGDFERTTGYAPAIGWRGAQEATLAQPQPGALLMIRFLAVALAALTLTASPCFAADFPLRDGQRVVFLGDSITNYGVYIQDIEAYVVTRFPDRKVEFINLGLSSETVSGLTEPDHPYPRPDVRERLGRALEMARPDLVVVCYGMNDGIYHPPSEERIALFRKGIEEIVERVKKAGADIVIVTPPPFDPKPITARLQPLGAAEYGYKHPFEGYDGVLGKFADWELSKRADGWKVVDVHGAVNRYVALIREPDPSFTLANDGVHPDASGHWLIAQEILRAWDAPAEVDSVTIDFKTMKASAGKVDQINREGNALRFSWTTRIPMPHDSRWDVRLASREDINGHFNQHRLTVTGEGMGSYDLFEGDRRVGMGVFGVELDLNRLPYLSTNRRAAEVRTLIAQRQGTLGPAWLEAVGHGQPVLSRALPLDEAKKKAAASEERIRELVRPVPIVLRIAPIPGK